jgi:hypothetical protein
MYLSREFEPALQSSAECFFDIQDHKVYLVMRLSFVQKFKQLMAHILKPNPWRVMMPL